MFLIRTHIGPSGIHGTGCFTDEPVEKGQVVWQPDPVLDLVISEEQLATYPETVQGFLRMYSYTELRNGARVYILCTDHSRHMNHADDPNVISLDGVQDVAARDIAAGEELTCNYYAFDLDAAKKLK